MPIATLIEQEISLGNKWKFIEPAGATNFVLNPSGEITGNFASHAAGVASRSSSYSWRGIYSYNVTTANPGDGIELTLATLANEMHFVSYWVRGGLPENGLLVTFNGVEHFTPEIKYRSGNWVRYGIPIPAANASGQAVIFIVQNGAGSGDFYIDAVQVEDNPYLTTYADGELPGCLWDGQAHASTSTRSPESRAGGRLRDFLADHKFRVEQSVGAGSISRQLIMSNYSQLPGSELSNIKMDPRLTSLVGRFETGDRLSLHRARKTLLSALASENFAEDAGGLQPVIIQYHGSEAPRQISAFYGGGLEGSIADVDAFEKVSIELSAPDPFWRELGSSAMLLDTKDTATFRYCAGRLKRTGQWSDLGLTSNPTTGGTVYAVAFNPINGLFYLGGNFTGWDGNAGWDYLVAYNPATGVWSRVGGASAVTGTVYAIAISPSGDVYIGGSFLNVGDADGDYVAYYDISAGTWNSLDAGGTGNVYALLFASDGNLYIGGNFLNWDGIGAADYVVRWAISTSDFVYTAAGAGLTSQVNAFAEGPDGTIYAGTSGGSYLYSFDGSSWTAFSSTVDDVVRALVWSDFTNELFIGGDFVNAGGSSALYIVTWTEAGFTAIGGIGMNGEVRGMAIAPDGILYVVGDFSSVGNIIYPAIGIARWHGKSWSATDSFITGAPEVHAVAIGRQDAVIQNNYDIIVGKGTTYASGELGGQVIVVNNGSAATYPKINVHRSGGGAAYLMWIRNERTGKELLSTYSIFDEDTIVIDLKPGNKRVYSQLFGGPLADIILPASNFGSFSLLPGDNPITVYVYPYNGATVTAWIEWQALYESFD